MSYYSIAENDRLKAAKEFRKKANELVFHIGMKVGEFSKKGIFSQEISTVAIRVNAEEVYHYDTNKGVKQNLSPETVDKINTAFDKPEDLKGSVTIEVNNKAIFFAQDGELFMNSSDLIYASHFKKPSLEEKVLTSDIESIATLWQPVHGERMYNAQRQSFYGMAISKDLALEMEVFDSENQDRKFLCVHSKEEKKIFDRNGFTKEATETEIDALKNRVCELKTFTTIKPEVEDVGDPISIAIYIKGESNRDHDWMTYETEKYICTCDEVWGDWLSVTSKESGKEIFNNFGYTNNASQNDKDALGQLASELKAEQDLEDLQREEEEREREEEMLRRENEELDELTAYEAFLDSGAYYDSPEQSFGTQPEGAEGYATMPFGKEEKDIDLDL